ncbi:DUF971 domain-containing protein [bacterium]|nr:DUF971 domain-containing protein [bacterium]
MEITRANVHDVRILWNDGHESVFPARDLRLACSCAVCVHEMTGQSLLDPKAVPRDVRPLKILPVGRYAIQIFWSDNHNTGLYAFDSLRRLCPCAACVSSASAN